MLLLFLISSAILILFQLLLLGGIWKHKRIAPAIPQASLPISVIIAAKDEAENLQEFLPSILTQKYPQFEVIVVLDRCVDRSQEIIAAFQVEYPFLKMVRIEQLPEGWAGKKWALTQGIDASSHEYLAFTDADCLAEKNWLSTLAQHFAQGHELILGVGMYIEKPGFLQSFIQFETLYTCLQFIGFAILGLPYMGVGRNLAYKKSFFLSNQGFDSFQARISGDDDILINKYAQAHTTTVMIEADTKTLSPPKETWRSWKKQKLRHLSASGAYSLKSQIVLGILHLSHAIFYLLFIYFLILQQTLCIVWASYISRMVLSGVVFLLFGRKLRIKQQLSLFPVLDLLYFIYNLSLVPIGLFQKRPAWS